MYNIKYQFNYASYVSLNLNFFLRSGFRDEIFWTES
jgi:hypothetical protein